MRLLNLKSTVRHVCKPDLNADGTPKDDATVFLLRTLTASEKGAIKDTIVDMNEMRLTVKEDGTPDVDMGSMGISMSGQTMKRVRLALIGWENLNDEEGNPVEFRAEPFRMGAHKAEAVAMELMEAFPAQYLAELDNVVKRISGLDAATGN